MEQKLNSIPPDGASAQKCYEDELTPSSQTIAKPIVVGSTAINELISWCILNAFNIESQDGAKYVAIDYKEMQSQLDYFVEKEKYQIMRAYEFGEGDAYNFKKENAEKYYNESYK